MQTRNSNLVYMFGAEVQIMRRDEGTHIGGADAVVPNGHTAQYHDNHSAVNTLKNR
jgi:hypothetical protein